MANSHCSILTIVVFAMMTWEHKKEKEKESNSDHQQRRKQSNQSANNITIRTENMTRITIDKNHALDEYCHINA